MSSVSRVYPIIHRGYELLIVDFSDCHGQSYIDVFNLAKEWLLREKRTVSIISVFNAKTFVTPDVMRFIEKELPTVDQFILKNTITGISATQQWILKGLNLWYKKQIHHFTTREEAIDFLSKP